MPSYSYENCSFLFECVFTTPLVFLEINQEINYTNTLLVLAMSGYFDYL